MIHLYQWPSRGKLPNSGVFCMKLESYLKLMKIDHKVTATTSLDKSPKKTMPFVEIDGERISDSRIIIEKLDAKMAQPIDAHLSEEQKAISVAFIALLENRLVQTIIYFRWFNDAGWSQFSRAIFKGAPKVIRVLVGGLMRKRTLKSLYFNGISRHSEAEITTFAKKEIASLAILLGEKPYVFGDQISLLDIVLFSVVANILHGSVDMPLIDLVRSHPNLVSHSEKLLKQIYGRTFDTVS